ncbi:MAG: CDP-diacylglycerol--serine O-phosphatidyltransferase [Gammaproteobacteria bacterium]|nr:CDP-diacylglycerol--serine O-phosphatidyltransferase [Gammaproteobacteria bacterium]
MDTENNQKPRRGIYLLPNLFTTVGLFAGFYAIVSAMDGRFEAAAIAIFVAMVMDGLDGRVARLTNTQSDFGMEYDSLSDMISFGLAPALVMYTWSLSVMGKLGWLAAFIYTACAALRLARFNTRSESTDKRFFQGLASPAAAALLVGLIWVGTVYGIAGSEVGKWTVAVTILAGGLMVSNIRYYSFKDMDFKGKVPFFVMLIVVLVFVFITLDPPRVLFSMAMIYAISGPVITLVMLYRSRRMRASGSEETGNDKTEDKQE